MQIPRRRRTVAAPRRAPPRPVPARAYNQQAASRPRAAGGIRSVPARVPSSQDIMRRSEDTLALMQEGAPMEFHDSLGVRHNASH